MLSSSRDLVELDRLRQARHHPAAVPTIYTLGGVVVALTLLSADAMIGDVARPAWLWVGPQTARSSLVGLITSFLFVISVVFWVRIWAVQLTAGSVLPRVLSQFLTDRVQVHAMGFLIGVIAYTLTVLRAVPEDDAAAEVPHLAVGGAHVATLVVAVIIVLVIHDAARSSQVGNLIRRIADSTVRAIRERHPTLGDGDSTAVPSLPRTPGVALHVDASGWVRDLDVEALLAATPPGAVVEVAVTEGTFVIAGRRVATVWPPEEWTEEDSEPWDRTAALDAMAVGAEPGRGDDVAYGINELVDILQRSVDPSSSDTTSARDALLHLGVVIRELLMHDLPSRHRTDAEGRLLVRTREPTMADHVEASFGRAREVVGHSPELLSTLVATIHELGDQMEAAGLVQRQDLLHVAARRSLEQARHGLTIDDDVRLVSDHARHTGTSPLEADDR